MGVRSRLHNARSRYCYCPCTDALDASTREKVVPVAVADNRCETRTGDTPFTRRRRRYVHAGNAESIFEAAPTPRRSPFRRTRPRPKGGDRRYGCDDQKLRQVARNHDVQPLIKHREFTSLHKAWNARLDTDLYHPRNMNESDSGYRIIFVKKNATTR